MTEALGPFKEKQIISSPIGAPGTGTEDHLGRLFSSPACMCVMQHTTDLRQAVSYTPLDSLHAFFYFEVLYAKTHLSPPPTSTGHLLSGCFFPEACPNISTIELIM